jgi:uncharacterized protein (TIGR02145 family)
MKIFIIIVQIFICFCPDYIFSQGEFNNWYFGGGGPPIGAGLTFNSGSPVPIPNGVMASWSSPISVSDSSGNLLFFSNGINVYNRNKVVMPNGSGLLGANGDLWQCVISTPILGDDSSYYIFTVADGVPSLLSYSILNMRLDGGLGDIEPAYKNISIPGTANAWWAVTGTRHKNNKDVWIITTISTISQLKYAAFLINSSGIVTTPVLSSSDGFGHIYLGNYWNPPMSIKVSPDGTKLATCFEGHIEFCTFNSQTGSVNRLFYIPPNNFNSTVCTEFSIDSKYLYVSNSTGGNGALYQYNATLLDSSGFIQSKILIDTGYKRNGLQMGPDWKIYGTEYFVDSLSVIQNPSNYGLSCHYGRNAIAINGPNSDALPQFIQRYKAYIHHTNLCSNNPINFSGDIWPPADSVHWNFGDPSSGAANFSNLALASHVYNNTGTYTVELFVRHNDKRLDTSWQTITIVASPQVSLGPARTICNGNSTTFDAGFCAGCTYEWKNVGTGLVVGTNQTFTTGNPGNYGVTVTNGNNCSAYDTVQVITTSVPQLTTNPLYDTICSGQSTNITLTSNPTGANFHWTATLTSGNITGFTADSGLVIHQVLTNSLSTAGIVTYHITPKIGNCTGTSVDFPVTVVPGDSVKVLISESVNNICAGTSVTFSANPTNPGTTPFFQWKVNGINQGANSPTYSYIPQNGDVVTCILTSSNIICTANNPATSNSIVMIVNPNLAVSVSISPNQNPVCAGASITFTATPTFGGTLPSYLWKVNGIGVGTNSDTYSFIPNNNDIVTCTLTSSESCTIQNPVTSAQYPVTVNPNLSVTIAINPSSNPFCLGGSVTFTATPNNQGLTPQYQWKVNGVIVGTNSSTYSYNPVNGDQVICTLNSSIACPVANPVVSNTITMIQNNNLPAGVSITASQNPFCPGSSVTFTSNPANGGGNPAYQWKVNGINVGTNSNTYSYSPVDGDSVRCIMTSNLSCVTGSPASSSKIIMSGTLAPTITFTSCFDTLTTLNAKPIKLKGGVPLGGIYSGQGVSAGAFYPAVAGVGTKTITYTYTNAALCSASKTKTIIVQNAQAFFCGNNVTDIRDGKTYPTVQLGSQCWMAANLNFGTILASTQNQRDNCISEKYCYNDNPTNCSSLGGLYQWDELMLFDQTPAAKGFCPPSWHIPTVNDWNVLFANFTNSAFAGSPLKYSGYSGFDAMLTGTRHLNKSWDFQGFATFFWSSTTYDSVKAWAHGMNDPDPSISAYPASKSNAFAVRCLHD